MAKKKATAKSKPKATVLTPEQFKQLGEQMLRSGGNIFTAAKVLFGADGGDELFDGVKKYADASKCEMCGQWKGIDEMSKDTASDICEECVSGDDLDD